jgi:hypothetical protein
LGRNDAKLKRFMDIIDVEVTYQKVIVSLA